jgi:hypothetical protein
MKPITLFCTALLLAVAGFVAGLLLGRQHTKTSVPAETTLAATADNTAPALPTVNVKPRAARAADAASDPMSLAEVEAALLELPNLPRSKMWERVNEIAKAIHPTDIPQALAFAAKLPKDVQTSLRYSLVARWAETDPRAAMEFASNIKNFNERNQMILSVLRGWAKEDATSAAAWVEQLPAGRLRNDATSAIACALAEKDPEAAFAMLKTAKTDRNQGYSTYHELFETWAGKDPATAALRAAEIKNWQQRQQAYQNIARRWAEKDVTAALAWAKSLPDGRDRSSALGTVLGAWAGADPRAATEAALALPAGQTRNNAIGSLASQWAQSDLPAAVAWVQQLPEGHGPRRIRKPRWLTRKISRRVAPGTVCSRPLRSRWRNKTRTRRWPGRKNSPLASPRTRFSKTSFRKSRGRTPRARQRLPPISRPAGSATMPFSRSPAIGHSPTPRKPPTG